MHSFSVFILFITKIFLNFFDLFLICLYLHAETYVLASFGLKALVADGEGVLFLVCELVGGVLAPDAGNLCQVQQVHQYIIIMVFLKTSREANKQTITVFLRGFTPLFYIGFQQKNAC